MQIVHRDMSPPNVLLTRFGEVKIVDFGLAKANSQLEHSEPGIIKGKFSYLSPEAAQGAPVDSRTDIFAAGIILWELLAGRRLFQGQSDLETVRMVQAARVPPIRQLNPHVSAQLEQVVARALAGDPVQRYQTAREFGYDLNQVLFSLGRAVSSFDIAQLVAPIWSERLEFKRRGRVDRGSLIGSLIDEALIEFTSLEPDGDRSSSSSGTGAAPLNIGSFENVQDWARDIGELGVDKRQDANIAQYELGNLSALEDEEVRSRRAPHLQRKATGAPVDEEPEQPAAPSKAGLIAIALAAMAAVAAAGAYYAGIIP
jgi:eukaryotic-like serine/threonine-protein kinase